MEVRRIQKTGGSSFTITLPKDWVEKSKLKEQSEVRVTVRPDGVLAIVAQADYAKHQRIVHSISKLTLEEIKREITSLYILGFDQVELESTSFSKAERVKIRQTLEVLVGFEIIEESAKRCLIRNILDLEQISFAQSTENMFRMARSMFEDAIQSVATHDSNLAQDIIERDHEVDRLYFLSIRQNHSLLQDITLEEKLGQTLSSAHYYESIAVQLERIADHTVKIAYAVVNAGNDVSPTPPQLGKTARQLVNILHQVSECTSSINRRRAHAMLDDLQKMKIDGLIAALMKDNQIKPILIGESLVRIHGYLTNLAEIIIDQSFSKSN